MDFVQLLLTILLIGSVVVAFTFWNQILDWATRNLFPWLQKNLPRLEPYVRNAFWEVQKVVKSTRKIIKTLKEFTEIKKAWEILREYLLKLLVQFEQKTPYKWIRRITYWVRSNIESTQVARVVLEDIVDVESLPDDVSEEWLKRGNTNQDVNVTQVRDRELNEVEKEIMSLSQ